MKTKILTGAAVLLMGACSHTGSLAGVEHAQGEAEIASCIRTIMALEQGRWNYMGTIGQTRGKFRTYEAIFIYAEEEPDMWSFKAFGGDVGGNEESADILYKKLVGTSLIPVEDGKLNEAEANKYTSCVGPDAEGRYEAKMAYKSFGEDGTYSTGENMTWYSEHGSYYTEDFYNEKGRVTARRSGVTTPIGQ